MNIDSFDLGDAQPTSKRDLEISEFFESNANFINWDA